MAERSEQKGKTVNWNQLNLDTVGALEEEEEKSGQYLVPKTTRRKSKAHLWTGDDIACRMASTDGINTASTKYKVVESTELPICKLCLYVSGAPTKTCGATVDSPQQNDCPFEWEMADSPLLAGMGNTKT